MHLKNTCILLIILFLVILVLPNKVYAGVSGPRASITSGCSAGAVWDGIVEGAQNWDSCPNIDDCPDCKCDFEYFSPSPVADIRWFIDGNDYGQPSTRNLETEGDDCDCYNFSTSGLECTYVCEGIPETISVSDTIPSGLSAGNHTLTLRVESAGRSHEANCTFNVACECSSWGQGWHDAVFPDGSSWGGCSDCNLNSTNNCGPCGQALTWCDGCYWHTDWDPFRDETYGDPGNAGGHKCPGNPKICSPSSNWCEGQYAWHCSSDGCSKWSENCNDFDGMYGSEYRDYYCSDGACTYTDYSN